MVTQIIAYYALNFTNFVYRNVPQGTRQGTIISYEREPILTYCQAEAGDNMGALLRGVKREQIRRGQVLAAPGTIKAAKQFLAQIYVRFTYFSIPFCYQYAVPKVLTKDEGKLMGPLVSQYADLYFRWTLHSLHEQLQTSMLHSDC